MKRGLLALSAATLLATACASTPMSTPATSSTSSTSSPTTSTSPSTTTATTSTSTATTASTTVSSESSLPAQPAGDLYQPPSPLPPGAPGQLIWARPVDTITFSPPQTVWLMLYHSRDERGNDVAVSGFAIVPTAPAPATGRAVYAWAHGTTGLGDQCAPSRSLRDNIPPYAGELVGGNALVVATDYEGLGTPGTHTYLAGRPEGQAVLDSIRAASSLPTAGPLGDIVLAGQSQGGGAALFAAELAPAYAPELHVRGVLAVAPAAELSQITTAVQTSPFKGLLLMAAAGLHADDTSFDPSTFLTPTANADLPQVANECVDATIARYANTPTSDIIMADPAQVAAVATVLDRNSPGHIDPGIPILLVQGEADEQIPVAVSAVLAAKYCALHAVVERRTYPGATHDGVLDDAHDDVVAWLNDRYLANPAPSTC